MKSIAKNPRAHFDYEILDTLEAGIELFGHEVKSAKLGNVSLKGSYVTISGSKQEVSLINAHIGSYKHAGNLSDYDPTRSRRLLLHRKEIQKLIGKKQEQGLTLVPLEIYAKRARLKVKIAIARGKKKYDKREAIKRREQEREIARAVRRKN
jgi:SsrA-binding protein